MPGLRVTAEADLEFILEDDVTGWAWDITMTDPGGLSSVLKGFSDDISQSIDPDTGMLVSGRVASIVLRLASIYAAGMKIPVGVSDRSSKPWVVTFNDINGVPYTFKISKTNPDRTLGIVSCLLETYNVL